MNQIMNPFLSMQKGFKIYKSNFKNILIISLIIYIPISIVMAMLSVYILRIDAHVNLYNVLTDPMQMLDFMKTKEYSLLMGYSAISTLIELIFVPIGTVAIAKLCYSAYKGIDYDFKDVVSFSFSKIFVIALSSILYGLAVACGTVLFIIPGIFIAISWYFYIYAIAVRDLKTLDSIRASKFVTKGNFLRIFLAIAVIWACNRIVVSFIGNLLFYDVENILGFLVFNIISYIISAFFICSYTILFCDTNEFKMNNLGIL